jgi:prevent-host-death family protein
MAEVGAYEAKTRLGELLKQVAKGERVTITKHGVPVAVLIPAGRSRREVVAETIASIKAFRKGRRLGRTTIAAMVAEGRR